MSESRPRGINMGWMQTRTKHPNISSLPMTRMQTQLGLQVSICADADAFDMWHDYMNLSTLLLRLAGNRDPVRVDATGPNKVPAADPWSGIQACAVRSNLRTSAGSSSVSSLSDTGSTGSTGASAVVCGFCKQNGESAKVYRSHRLKSNGKVVCPILRSYTCPTCGATGEHAHTRKYCPRKDDGMLPWSTPL